MADDVQHVYHHYDNDGARVNVSFERNSRGVNYSATVTGARTVAEAMELLVQTEQALDAQFKIEQPKEAVAEEAVAGKVAAKSKTPKAKE